MFLSTGTGHRGGDGRVADPACRANRGWEAGRGVLNGYLPERSILTGLGDVAVKVPEVRDRSGGGIKFNSQLEPPYLKRTKNVELDIIFCKD